MKDKLDPKGLLFGLVLGAVIVLGIGAASFTTHENDSPGRYSVMQDKLKQYGDAGDEKGLHVLNAQLDAQLKLEDFLIKYREAEHAKAFVWGTIVLPGIVSIIASVVTTLLSAAIAHRWRSRPHARTADTAHFS
jgi:hypothetical protein